MTEALKKLLDRRRDSSIVMGMEELTEFQKKAECERICGEKAERGIHSIAPQTCPIELDNWKNPKRKKEY